MKIDFFKIEEWMNKYEHLAKYDMTATCIKSFSLKEFFEFTNTDFSEIYEKPLDYGYITGSPRLKNNIADLYSGKSEKNVTVTLGAIGANSLVFTSLLNRGDEVVSIIPTYQQHYSIPKQLGCNVKIIKLKPELNWHIDFEELENAVSEKTKLITLNNPNNPTGAVLSEAELKKIANIAKTNNAYILCDEVYRFLNHNSKTNNLSIAEIYADKGISTFSMSKTFSLAGIRVGFIIANETLTEEFQHQRQYNTISISAIDDYIACLALENKDKIIKRNKEIVLAGKKTLTDWVSSENKISLIEPEAGTIAFIKYDDKRNSYDFCLDLFKTTGVLLLPGDAMEVPKHCRIGYCGNLKHFSEGLSEFSKWLKN
ncbi:MAG: aminotransferase class I/II-fold pyridoxal phosphate-dependent enzyme [Candidatus Gastranaerophilales bacterium]|nr:aminotransferase class I/II-fold pyridoxal phosphate-dependent enzyme [Candidatus Gastranaerophilales bacterium]